MAEKSVVEGNARGGTRGRRKRGVRSTGSPIADAAATICPEVDVGRAIRKIREEQGFSIRALAEKSSLAVNTLSLIENGKTSPSVSTLQQLAGALKVHITAFFEFDSPENNVIYTKGNCRPHALFTHGVVEDLGAGLSGRMLQPFVFTLEVGAVSGTQPVVHTGQEFVLCLEGRIAYTIEERSYVLEPGDSLLFESHLPHRWQNVAEGHSKALLVLCPSDDRDEPSEVHFTPR